MRLPTIHCSRNVAMHTSNLLLVQVGSQVPAERQAALDEACLSRPGSVANSHWLRSVIVMLLTDRELWTVIHGMGLGALFLLAFAGGLAGLWSLRPEFMTVGGLRERIPRLEIGTAVMAVVAWATVLIGTYVVYPWYRDAAATSAKSLLL